MNTNLLSDILLLYQDVAVLVDEYKATEHKKDMPLPPLTLPPDMSERFDAILAKINLRLMDDSDNFYGYFLFQMGKSFRFDIASPSAVTFKNGKYVMHFNPYIFLALTIEQMESDIKHEIIHILSLHLMRAKEMRTKYSKLAVNLAMDIAANMYLDNVPPDSATLAWVNMAYTSDAPMAPYETYELYAERIQEELNKFKLTEDACDPGSSRNDMIQEKYDPEDTHDIWDESDDADEDIIKAFTQTYIENARKGELPNYLESMLATLKEDHQGLPWDWYLKKLVGSVTAGKKKTTTRRNRRQPERLDLPGQLKGHKAKIFIALDISGSISDGEFKQAMEEVLQIVRSCNHEITIVECDDHIRRVYAVNTIHDLKERLKIRGSTAFSPVFEYANSQHIDLLVYFTDGVGEATLKTKPRGYKPLWILSGHSDALSIATPYGMVKRLKPIDDEDLYNFDDVQKGGFDMNNQERISVAMDRRL
ncbi:VWA-like domain-containing protein [Megasphaera vaginalis (ex Bordigoni et al. 2020)]|uniref:vWA domain-containing protein n=1 Tax=Megasphaera vaginalis (ex Bordigoni et al. 2020) TaxID=2045301 RepID=UPI000C7CFE2D|nr:VWA-like domain-containing protein [Megasphaera vaginalis (ex Bordigoni et al. 2020)]